ncbi:MAG TPA: hypothetical protein VHW23_23860 [Kofleriaceae bacterium]|jgi:hypothetical protein|nr:hypothetical protein [Kofleriaceae bacterium]
MMLRTAPLITAIAASAIAPGAAIARPSCDAPRVAYDISNPETSWITTPMSPWARPGFVLGVDRGTTVQVVAPTTATVGSAIDAVVARVGSSAGKPVRRTVETTVTESARRTVPAHQRARLMMYHEARSYQVTRKEFDPSTCRYQLDYTTQVKLPVKGGAVEWALQSRKDGAPTLTSERMRVAHTRSE